VLPRYGTLVLVWDGSSRGCEARLASSCTDIEVLYCFHQDNDGSKCEAAHTSPPIRP